MKADRFAEAMLETFKPAVVRTKISGQGTADVQWRSEPDPTRYGRLLQMLLGSHPVRSVTDQALGALPWAALLVGIPAIAAGVEELQRWT